MIIRVGYKMWSNGNQQGLRLYADSIRALGPALIYPSHNTSHGSLHDFLDEVEAGDTPVRYSRHVFVSQRGQVSPVSATATFATLPPKSVQGYVTAAVGTWFHALVTANLDSDIDADYQPTPSFDLILIP